MRASTVWLPPGLQVPAGSVLTPAVGPEPQGLCTGAWPQARWHSIAAAGASAEGGRCQGTEDAPHASPQGQLPTRNTEGLCLWRPLTCSSEVSMLGLPQLHGESHVSLISCYSAPAQISSSAVLGPYVLHSPSSKLISTPEATEKAGGSASVL